VLRDSLSLALSQRERERIGTRPVRKLYVHQTLRKLREGNVLWVPRQAWKYAAVKAGMALGRPLAGPVLGTIFVTYRCNIRCRMCDLPAREGPELTTDEWKAVVDDFAALGTTGIGYTGGEPLLRGDCLELMAYTKERGMIAHLNTNGMLVGAHNAGAILRTGAESVNISLDGATAETHNAIRRDPEAFERALDGAAHLVEWRRKTGASTKLTFVCVLSEENVDEALELVQLSEKVGFDGVGFIPVHGIDTELRPVAPERMDAFRSAVDALIRAKKAGAPVDNSERYLSLYEPFVTNGESPLRCYAGYNSLAVDCFGKIFPCFPWAEVDRAVGNVRETPLAAFWKSDAYNAKRKDVASCTECLWNCQTELNLLWN